MVHSSCMPGARNSTLQRQCSTDGKNFPMKSWAMPHSNHELRTDCPLSNQLAVPTVDVDPVLPVFILLKPAFSCFCHWVQQGIHSGSVYLCICAVIYRLMYIYLLFSLPRAFQYYDYTCFVVNLHCLQGFLQSPWVLLRGAIFDYVYLVYDGISVPVLASVFISISGRTM